MKKLNGTNILGITAALMLLTGAASAAEIPVSSGVDNPAPEPGETVTVSITIDLSATTYTLAEYSIECTWDPAVIRYESAAGGTTQAFSSVETVDSEAASGALAISWLDIDGSGGKVNVAAITFTAVGTPGQKTLVDLNVLSLSATTLDDLLPGHTVVSGEITILGPPSLVSPADLSYVPRDQSFTRSWDAVPNAAAYQVQESADPAFTGAGETVAATLSTTSYTTSIASSYTADSPLYWRVRAEVGGGYGGWSDAWRLYTDLGELELLAPEDLAYVEEGTLLTYRWSPVVNAAGYQLVAGADPEFAGVTPVTIAGTTYSDALEGEYTADDPYYWRVRAEVNGEYGEWSGTRRIITRPADVAPPTDVTVDDVPDDNGHSLRITWTLSVDDDILTAYNIYRSRGSVLGESPVPLESFASLDALIEAEATSTILIASVSAGISEYVDPYVPLNNTPYYYWVEAVSDVGSSARIAAQIVTAVASEPSAFRVEAPSPNPFNPSTTIAYTLPIDTAVRITVHDVLGRRVAVLVDDTMPAGRHEALWNARDDSGNSVSSGIYFYRVQAGKMVKGGKMTLVR